MKKRWLSVLLALVMALGLAPVPAQAAGIGETEIRVNETKVAFGGREWWVIGDGSSGVFPQTEHITLWAVEAGGDLGCVAWRFGTKEQRENTTRYRYSKDYDWVYYDNNPSGMKAWKKPSEYAGSTLQLKMEELANALPEKERRLLWGRTLTVKNDGVFGQDVEAQKLWPLSYEEYFSIDNSNVKRYPNGQNTVDFWSRDGDDGFGDRAFNMWGSGYMFPGTISPTGLENTSVYIRPAATMTMRNWVFTSSADATGKSAATVGGGLVKLEKPEGTIKFTMKSSAQTLKVYATDEGLTDTLHFAYSDAPVGENQYISCLIKDEQGNMLYYGKLASCAERGSGTAELKIPVTDETRGKNLVVSIFSEEANGDRYTDFCSENPVTMKLKNEGGGQAWSLEDFTGEKHTHQWDGDAWTADNDGHWHACRTANCPLGENRLKDGYGEHVYDQKVEKYEYKFDGPQCDRPALYFYSCVCGKMGSEMFTVGEARHNWSACVQVEGDKHRRRCWKCDLEDISPCYGGVATCRWQAMCELCFELYGSVDPNNHEGTWSWTQTAETHGKQYSCCGATVEVENHVWVGGACSVCGYLHDHVGGKATCTSGPVCVVCSNEYGQPDPTGHDPAAEWTQENGKHYHACKNGCGTHLDEAECSGGTADCVKKAECDTCGGAYGTVDAANHDPAAEWSQENDKHYHACKNGCGTHLDEADCSGGTADCMKKAECAVCGGEYGAVDAAKHDPAAEWTQENEKHYHACKNGCGTHLDEAECSGGMPTCSKKAKCQVCGNEFGELFPHNFCQYGERAATCTEDGQKAHRICVECQLILLLDGAEATRAGLVIPATGHNWGAPEWTWNEDGTAATVRFTCQNDGTHREEPAVVMSHKVVTPAACTEAGAAVYTAKVTFEDQDYEDSRTVALPALGHDVTHVAAQAPTETEPGHKEYWVCARCGLYFGDKELTAVLQPEDVVLPATGKGDSGSGKGENGADKGTPATGDSGSLTLWAALLTVSGGAWLALRRKPREK